ncbi:MAG TPA: TIGR03618 family F420-dependent PPOX class oxidoreductase, partial [Acidimicrobiales bacterium]|nr:TIGR03618 family F420-dependent PPOX class oxidoreductase [Acidimicrobiales bacterium]
GGGGGIGPAQHDLLRRMRHAVLATTGAAGSPHLAPVWYAWDGERFVVSTVRDTVKVADLRRDDRVAICVDDQVSGDYLTAYGRAELVEGERVGELTRPLLLKYLHADEAEARWSRIDAGGRRVAVLIRPDRVIWRAGVH